MTAFFLLLCFSASTLTLGLGNAVVCATATELADIELASADGKESVAGKGYRLDRAVG